MSVQHALLTSLLERPSSGYELARRFDRSIGYFWHATHQQIYRELGRMAEHGWIAEEEGEGESDARNRKEGLFRAAAGARRACARWVLAPTAGLDLRDEILVKLRADAVVGPLGLRPEMQRLIGLHQERLDTYRQIERRDFSAAQPTRAQLLQHALLKRGIRYEEDWVSWAEELLPLLDKQDDPA
ncbi:PadR family transcriptional regulator [Cupriavidus basilensis]